MAINKDQVQGGLNEIKGKVKEIAGKTVGNKELEIKGDVQQIVGGLQHQVGDYKAAVKTAADAEAEANSKAVKRK